MRVPDISKELINWLQTTHPQQVLKKGETLEDAARRAGLQDCIDILQYYHHLQTTPDLPAEMLAELEGDDDDDDRSGGFIRVGR